MVRKIDRDCFPVSVVSPKAGATCHQLSATSVIGEPPLLLTPPKVELESPEAVAADIDTTPKGSEYKDLKQNYVIFICTFDPFHQRKPIYSFQNYCVDYGGPIPLADGTEKIFLNTTAKDLTNLDGEMTLFYDLFLENILLGFSGAGAPEQCWGKGWF